MRIVLLRTGVALMALCLILGGFTAVLGHLVGEPILYRWRPAAIGMALNTALFFIVCGAAFLALAALQSPAPSNQEGRHAP